MKREDYQLIFGALEVGLPDDGEREIESSFPWIPDNLPPPIFARAVITIDGQPYEVFVKGVEPGEAHEPDVQEG
jgi:hypothetical protein